MSENSIRPRVWVPVLCFALVLAAVVVVLEPRGVRPSVPAKASIPPPPEQPSARSAKSTLARNATVEPDPVPYIEGQVWGDIDLREVQTIMPDNLYWQLGAPTKDPAVLEAREKEKARRNEEYGRVLSGDASEDEVRAYYDYRKRLSNDYLEFADYMRRRFDSSLSDEFKGMLDLAVKLHTARLAQIPADEEAALERAREHARIREEWQREQQEFGNAPAGDPSSSAARQDDLAGGPANEP